MDILRLSEKQAGSLVGSQEGNCPCFPQWLGIECQPSWRTRSQGSLPLSLLNRCEFRLIPSASTVASGATPTPCSRSTPGSPPSFKLDHPPTLEVPGTPKTPDNSFEVTRLEDSLSSHGHSNQNLDSTVTRKTIHSVSVVDSEATDSASPGTRLFLSRSRGSIIRPENRSASVLIPSNREQAKQLWRESQGKVSSLLLPPKPPRKPRDPTSTPVSSRVIMVVCHGCHGPLGDGAHQGSGPGKNRCTLEHHVSCPGGIPESSDWRSCPVFIPGGHGHISQAHGFTQTLSESQFTNGVQSQQQTFVPQPASSTPALTVHGQKEQHQPSVPQPALGQVQASDPLWTQRLRSRPQVNYNEDQPVDLSVVSPSQSAEQQVNGLRASNQALVPGPTPHVRHDPGLVIQDLRANPQLRAQVEEQVQVIREDISALSAAPSAGFPQQPAVTGGPPPTHVPSVQ